MASFLFQLGHSPESRYKSPWQIFRAWIKEEFVLQKLNSPLGYLLFLGLAYLIAWPIGQYGWGAASYMIVGLILVPCLIGAVFNTRFGLYMLLIFSFGLPLLERFGVALYLDFFVDLSIWLLLFGVLVQQSRVINRTFRIQPLVLAIFLWVAYCLLQLLNPWAPSAQAWAFAVRGVGGYTLVFFAALYGLRKLSHIQWLLGIWIALATLGAGYGLIQEFGGFREFEWEWLLTDYDHFEAVYTWERLRIFSFFSGPASFGITMSVTSLLCMILIIETRLSLRIKSLLGVCTAVMLLAMLYSGTRTAFLILPASFGFLMLIHFGRRLWMSGVLLGVAAGILIWALPIESASLDRMRSSLRPKEAVSFQVRMENQEYVQPYLLDHPIGGGLGSTGEWGERFAPHTLLSMFPPDSGYVRIAIEMGYIGLALYLLLMFTGLAVGVVGYFRIADKRLRPWLLACLGVVFALVLANYPQQALTQEAIGMIFFFSLAAIVRLSRLTISQNVSTADLHR